MKKLVRYCLVTLISIFLLSCELMEKDLDPSKIVGYWYADNGNWKYNLEFDSDGTGEMDGQATNLSYEIIFAYVISGNDISITGVQNYSNGEVKSYKSTYTYSDGHIYNSTKSLEFSRSPSGSKYSYNSENQGQSGGSESSHTKVDLGLSVKWATCNVGASKPEDYGDYFAWGETSPKSTYSWSTYKYSKGLATTLTKYCKDSRLGNNGYSDSKTVLDSKDDAARVNWGGSWRMPTKAEFDELLDNCSWTWTTMNGVKGCKLVSKKPGYSGNYIFLPAAGGRHDTTPDGGGSYGYYLSSSLYTTLSCSAYTLRFNSSSANCYGYDRYQGFSVRPVCP